MYFRPKIAISVSINPEHRAPGRWPSVWNKNRHYRSNDFMFFMGRAYKKLFFFVLVGIFLRHTGLGLNSRGIRVNQLLGLGILLFLATIPESKEGLDTLRIQLLSADPLKFSQHFLCRECLSV